MRMAPPRKRFRLVTDLANEIGYIRTLTLLDPDSASETHQLCGESERFDTSSQLGMRGMQSSPPESCNDDAAYVLSSYLKPADSCAMSHPVMGSLALKSEPADSMPGPRLVRGDTADTEVLL